MKGKAYAAWFSAGLDLWRLGAEANTVIALRLARLSAGGPAADREAALMVSEKIKAAIELQTRMLTGALGTTPLSTTRRAVKHYKQKVARNRKRLARDR